MIRLFSSYILGPSVGIMEWETLFNGLSPQWRGCISRTEGQQHSPGDRRGKRMLSMLLGSFVSIHIVVLPILDWCHQRLPWRGHLS